MISSPIASGVPVALLLVAVAALCWPGTRVKPVPAAPAADATSSAAEGSGTGGRRKPPSALPAKVLPASVQSGLVGVSTVVVAVAGAGLVTGALLSLVAVPFALAGVAWLRRRPVKSQPDRALPLCLDLVAAVLRSGRPVGDALSAAAPVVGGDAGASLVRVSRLLRLGADPIDAWRSCVDPPGVLDAVVAVAIRSHTSGIRLADAFERLADELRAECEAAAVARANRAGVRAMGPLAACFLPSFLCLGIVPVVVGIATTVLGTIR